MNELPYYRIPEPPQHLTGTTVLLRLVDALGFRYRWASERLRSEDADFRPAPDCMSLLELLKHILDLVRKVSVALGAEAGDAPQESGIGGTRVATLAPIVSTRDRLITMSDDELSAVVLRRSSGQTFPIWNAINGPIADALTHVGQVNGWRRAAGNPCPEANVFTGEPPGQEP